MKGNNKLVIGVAKGKLTPVRDAFLGGYADKDNEINLCNVPRDVLGDVFVRVLLMESGEKRVLFVLVDGCVLIEGDNIPAGTRQNFADLAGTTPDCVFIINTHNHQSLKYFGDPEIKIIRRTVEKALENKTECRMESHTVTSDIGINRRPKYGVALDLPYDNRMILLRFCRVADGKPIGLVYNYPMHNTSLGNGHIENWHYMSSELTGFASLQLDDLFNRGNIGESGNIGEIGNIGENAKEDKDEFVSFHFNGFYGASGPHFGSSPTAPHPVIRENGETLGRWIASQAEEAKMKRVDSCIIKTGSDSRKFEINQVYGENATEEIRFYGMALGTVAFLGVDCEPFSEIGARIRACSPFDTTILLANMNGFSGYIPTYAAFHSGEDERECALNKTPYIDQTEELFVWAAISFLMRLAGKSIFDHQSFRKVEFFANDETSYYRFKLDNQMECNRLVINFGEKSPKECSFSVSGWDEKCGRTIFTTVQKTSLSAIGLSFPECLVKEVVVAFRTNAENGKTAQTLNFDLSGIKIG